MDISVGIDLGTTNTVLSIGHRGLNGIVEVETQKITQIGEDKVTPVDSELLSSVLYIDDGIPFVGKVAEAMKSQNRKRVISNSKNHMGDLNYKWIIDDKEYTPEVVASYYLKAVRNFIKSKFRNEELLKSAVITVPASFDIDQKRATKTAARLAGFEEDKIILISEPTAAMLDFINQQRKYPDESKDIDFSKNKKVLVFDLGGGTCDVAILDIKMLKDEVNVEEVAVSPHTLIGGANFDMYAVQGIIDDYNKINNTNLENEIGEDEYRDLQFELSIRCERAKLFFSGRYNYFKDFEKKEFEKRIEDLSYEIKIPNILNDKPFEYKLYMMQYNKFIEPLLTQSGVNVENIVDPIVNTLNSSNIKPSEIDYVFCVGGMTMYPAVLDSIKSFLKKEPVCILDRMLSTSRGAAVFHYYKVNIIDRERKKQRVDDTVKIDIIPSMPQTVFLNVKNNFPIPLIEAGTKAGTPMAYDNLIVVDSELSVDLEMYAGRSYFDPKLKKLRKATLEFPRGIERGSGISLKVEYTDSGILNFDAWLTKDKNVRIRVCLDDLFISDKDLNNARNHYKLEAIRGVY